MGSSVERDSYDFVVVGAGAAGCAIAGRLSEEPNTSVLLLEAGIHDLKHPNIRIPSRFGALLGTEITWDYHAEPKEGVSFGLNDNQVYCPRGKVLGGTTSINYLSYVRGVKGDYNKWAQLGCEGWDYENVLPYFKKLEGNRIPSLSSKYHSTDGPMRVTANPYRDHPISQAFVEAAVELGHPINNDHNGESQLGVSPQNPLTLFNGERWSAATGYLRPAELDGRENLTIVTCAYVTRILFNDAKEAQGVFYKLTAPDASHEEQLVRCNKEVIISGGSINSPQILMLSGIGPKQHLKDVGIDCIVDLPVGENLIDHNLVSFDIATDLKTANGENCTTKESVERYLEHKEGPIAEPSGNAVVIFAKSGLRPDLEAKGITDRQIYLAVGGPGKAKQFPQRADILNISPEYDIRDSELDQYTDNQAAILVFNNHPKSVGRITLKSSDPFEHPRIDANFLDHPDDITIMADGVKHAYDLCKTEAMQRVTGDLKPYSKCHHEPGTQEWSEWMTKAYVTTGFHPAGTCRMGDVRAKHTVVSPTLEVKGIKNLRVADASVMPVISSGNTMTPTIMIGEKCADMIKERWRILSPAKSKL